MTDIGRIEFAAGRELIISKDGAILLSEKLASQSLNQRNSLQANSALGQLKTLLTGENGGLGVDIFLRNNKAAIVGNRERNYKDGLLRTVLNSNLAEGKELPLCLVLNNLYMILETKQAFSEEVPDYFKTGTSLQQTIGRFVSTHPEAAIMGALEEVKILADTVSNLFLDGSPAIEQRIYSEIKGALYTLAAGYLVGGFKKEEFNFPPVFLDYIYGADLTIGTDFIQSKAVKMSRTGLQMNLDFFTADENRRNRSKIPSMKRPTENYTSGEYRLGWAGAVITPKVAGNGNLQDLELAFLEADELGVLTGRRVVQPLFSHLVFDYLSSLPVAPSTSFNVFDFNQTENFNLSGVDNLLDTSHLDLLKMRHAAEDLTGRQSLLKDWLKSGMLAYRVWQIDPVIHQRRPPAVFYIQSGLVNMNTGQSPQDMVEYTKAMLGMFKEIKNKSSNSGIVAA